MNAESLFEIIGLDFYTGVPDSLLKPYTSFLMNKFGIDSHHHIIGTNEGNCVALAAGYHLSTGKIPVVYLQNSGEGNIVNPIASLLNENVYAIPTVFIIGWRGEPGVKDEPQHIFQGSITTKLLDVMDINYMVIDKDTLQEEVFEKMKIFKSLLHQGKSIAFVIKKNSIQYSGHESFKNDYYMEREKIIRHIVKYTNGNPIVSTTGKISRELYETREECDQEHKYDFLTVGSMGHSSSIALSVAINKPKQKIWCIDGDGALLMHMGAMAVIGSIAPKNLVHIVLNNCAHESVGGLPTVACKTDFVSIAKACGYQNVSRVDSYESLDSELELINLREGLTFVEVLCSIGSRENLGRPTTTPIQNKQDFMNYLKFIV